MRVQCAKSFFKSILRESILFTGNWAYYKVDVMKSKDQPQFSHATLHEVGGRALIIYNCYTGGVVGQQFDTKASNLRCQQLDRYDYS